MRDENEILTPRAGVRYGHVLRREVSLDYRGTILLFSPFVWKGACSGRYSCVRRHVFPAGYALEKWHGGRRGRFHGERTGQGSAAMTGRNPLEGFRDEKYNVSMYIFGGEKEPLESSIPAYLRSAKS